MKSGYESGLATSQSSSVSVNTSKFDGDDGHGKARRLSHDLHVETQAGTTTPHVDDIEQAKAADQPVTWSALPRKDQLLVLMLARLSEPLTQTSTTSSNPLIHRYQNLLSHIKQESLAQHSRRRSL